MARRGSPKGIPKRSPGRPKGGRNKATREIKELAEPYGVEALETLVRIMRKDKNSMARIAASKEILDRAYGKPSQPLTPAPGSGGLIIELVRFGPTLEHPAIQEALPSPSGDP